VILQQKDDWILQQVKHKRIVRLTKDQIEERNKYYMAEYEKGVARREQAQEAKRAAEKISGLESEKVVANTTRVDSAVGDVNVTSNHDGCGDLTTLRDEAPGVHANVLFRHAPSGGPDVTGVLSVVGASGIPVSAGPVSTTPEGKVVETRTNKSKFQWCDFSTDSATSEITDTLLSVLKPKFKQVNADKMSKKERKKVNAEAARRRMADKKRSDGSRNVSHDELKDKDGFIQVTGKGRRHGQNGTNKRGNRGMRFNPVAFSNLLICGMVLLLVGVESTLVKESGDFNTVVNEVNTDGPADNLATCEDSLIKTKVGPGQTDTEEETVEFTPNEGYETAGQVLDKGIEFINGFLSYGWSNLGVNSESSEDLWKETKEMGKTAIKTVSLLPNAVNEGASIVEKFFTKVPEKEEFVNYVAEKTKKLVARIDKTVTLIEDSTGKTMDDVTDTTSTTVDNIRSFGEKLIHQGLPTQDEVVDEIRAIRKTVYGDTKTLMNEARHSLSGLYEFIKNENNQDGDGDGKTRLQKVKAELTNAMDTAPVVTKTMGKTVGGFFSGVWEEVGPMFDGEEQDKDEGDDDDRICDYEFCLGKPQTWFRAKRTKQEWNLFPRSNPSGHMMIIICVLLVILFVIMFASVLLVKSIS